MTQVSTSVQTNATTAATTTGINTTGMTVIVVATSAFHASVVDAVTTITDNKGNTYTRIGRSTLTGSIWVGLYYCANPTVGTGHTFTYNLSVASDVGIAVLGDDSLTSATLDQGSNATFTTAGTGTTVATPSLTTTSAAELLVSVYANDDGADTATIANAGTGTPSTAWSIDQQINGSAGMRITQSVALTNATGSYAARWTVNASTATHATGIASFASGAGGAFDPGTVPWPAADVLPQPYAVAGF